MKNIFLLITGLCCSLLAFAQTEPDSVKMVDFPPPPPQIETIDTTWTTDSTNFDFDYFYTRKPFKNFEAFSIGTSTFVNDNGVFFSNGQRFQGDLAHSWNIHFDIAEKINYANDKNEFGWGYAISYGYQQMGIANNLRFHTYGNQTQVTLDSSASKTNNFRSFRLYVPLFVEYNYFITNRRVFHVNLGVNLGLRTLRYCIKEETSDRSELRIIDKTNMNYNYFLAEATLRVGLDGFSVFITKSLLPIFNDNAGVTPVFPLQFGIAFKYFD